VTTVLATIARALSQASETCIIVDADPDSLLPCHFSITERRDAYGVQAAVMHESNPVFLLKKTRTAAGGPADNTARWLESCLTPLTSSLHRILVDGTSRFWESEHPVDFGSCLNLVIVTPDLNSVYRIESITKALAGQDVVFVLNKFDAAVGLHEQVRVWLARKLGERLLGVTLRRSDEPAEALAEGITVIDYAPSSGIADDYRALSLIVREWNAQMPRVGLAKKELTA
jgi:hypothetical protein